MTVDEMLEEIHEQKEKGLIQGEDTVMVGNATGAAILSEVRPLSDGFIILDP